MVFPGNSGAIHVQVDPNNGYLQYGIAINRIFFGGTWTYEAFFGTKGQGGGKNKSTDTPHASYPPSIAKPGRVFSVVATYVDPFGFIHTSVPNACIVP